MQGNYELDPYWLACSRAKYPVVITGAGISVASGLPTIASGFRGKSIKDLFKWDNARRHVREYQQLYEAMITDWQQAQPSAAHRAIAERQMRVITQNVDGLHKRAGSKHVIELHGSLFRRRCFTCKRSGEPTYPFESKNASKNSRRHEWLCNWCHSELIPDLVLEGEPVRHFALALNWLTTSDLLLIVGTALEMQPINAFPLTAIRSQIPVVTVNRAADERIPALLGSQPLRLITSENPDWQ